MRQPTLQRLIWNNFRPVYDMHRSFLLVSLDVEINPRFYRGKKKERSDKKVGRAWCEPKDF